MSVEKVANDADAVVIGTLTHGVQTASGFSGTLEIKRVLKGTVAPDALVPISWRPAELNPLFGPTSQSIPDSEGMWFLKNSNGFVPAPLVAPAYDPPDFFEPVLAAPLLPGYQPPAGASLMDRILLEMASTVERGRPFGTSQLVFLIGQRYATTGASTYAVLMTSKNEGVRAAALSAAVRFQDSSFLVKYEPMFASLAKTGGTAETLVVTAIELCRANDPATLAVLGRLALTTEPTMRRWSVAAARALAAIHSPAALPILRKLLDSSDSQLRTAGVNGLSSFAMNLPVRDSSNFTTMTWMKPMGQSAYLTDEVKQHIQLGPLSAATENSALVFWRAWWSDNEASLPK